LYCLSKVSDCLIRFLYVLPGILEDRFFLFLAQPSENIHHLSHLSLLTIFLPISSLF